jgi:fructokinase
MGNTRSEEQPLLGGIEAGGTKFNCVIGRGPHDIHERASFVTTAPERTFAQVRDFFIHGREKHGVLAALGIASFGPVELNERSDTYGFITRTPKPAWSSTDIVGYFKKELKVPISFETDVNGAAMGEYLFGAGRGTPNFVYVTVGTGIGAGVMSQGKLICGHSHPELGHILIPHDKQADAFPGNCPFHGDCIEGLASGPALAARWGKPAEQLSSDHPAWVLQAQYLAMLCVNLTQSYGPEKIILGGGVMEQVQLFPMIREKFSALMGGYMSSWLENHIDDYIIPPLLKPRSGELGALALASVIAG